MSDAKQVHMASQSASKLPGVKHIIAVSSGKGGVGKTTVSVNLAMALAQAGYRTGLCDADIYGPNTTLALGSDKREIEIVEDAGRQFVLPIEAHGLQTMSIGYLIDEDTAMIWRGPMVTRALMQLVFDTKWDNLDYLILDLPPGTGDIQLTMAQKIPVSAAIVVATAQSLAVADVNKAMAMLAKVRIPVLGIVQNMSLHTCSACGHQEAIFGAQQLTEFAAKHDTRVLADIPLDKAIGEATEAGVPFAVAQPSSAIATTFAELASAVQESVTALKKPFPKIVIE